MNEDKAVRYRRLRRLTTSIGVGVRGCVLLGVCSADFLARHFDIPLVRDIDGIVHAGVVACALCLVCECAAFPFVLYGEFKVERRFGVSRESLKSWFRGYLRVLGIELVGWAAAASVMYSLITHWPENWWFLVAVLYFVVAVVCASVAPLVLVPWVFRAVPMRQGTLYERLEASARRAGSSVMGIEEWNVGTKSDYANAVLIGLGPARRVLLSSTLLEDYSDDEIEVIVTHELGHHAHGDVWKMIMFDAFVVFIACCISAQFIVETKFWEGLFYPLDITDLAAFVLVLSVTRIALSPLSKWISRRHEQRADAYALAATKKCDAFVSGLRRLASQQLVEERPTRLIEWLFYSHPPMAVRLEYADRLRTKYGL